MVDALSVNAYRTLLIPQLLEHASVQFAEAEIVSVDAGSIYRSTYHQLHRRVRRLATALAAIGVRPGDSVASIAWNDHRHIELYFAVTGLGAALHTIDPLLETAAIRHAIHAAADRFLCFDAHDEIQAARLMALSHDVLGVISMTSTHFTAGHQNLLDYEKLLTEHEQEWEWALTEQNTVASITAVPEHPQRLRHDTHKTTAADAVAQCADDIIAPGAHDNVLLAVPLWLPGAWGLACSVAISGETLVLPGAGFSAERLFDLLRAERITLALASPNAWTALLDFLDLMRLDATQVLPLRRAISCTAMPDTTCRTRLLHAFGPDVVSTWSPPSDLDGSFGFADAHEPGTGSSRSIGQRLR